MNDGFRQRLVGAIVLICLALVIWPMIFTDVESPIVDRRSQIPDMPEFERYTIEQPVKPEVAAPTNTDVITDSTLGPGEEQGLDRRGLPVSWVLQVASFSKEENAQELKRKLQQKGYKAFIKTVKAGASTSSRVYTGPKLNKTQLAKDKKAIDKAYKLKSVIVRYEQ